MTIEGDAPLWAQRWARDLEAEIEAATLSLFISRTPIAKASLPAASDHTNKIALLSDGTFWLAKSNGTNWIYPDNTTVT